MATALLGRWREDSIHGRPIDLKPVGRGMEWTPDFLGMYTGCLADARDPDS
jgi:hypothetical protein